MLSWALGNTLIALLFVVVLRLAERWLRSRPALVHFLWVVALGVLLMPGLPGVDTPGNGLRRWTRSFLSSSAAAVPLAPEIPPGASLAADVDPLQVGRFEAAAPLEAGAALPALVANPQNAPSAPPLRTWALLAWLVGAAFVLGRSAQRVWGFQRVVRHALPAPATLQADVRRVARRMGVAVPRVRSLAGVASPSIWCLGRPQLLWPQDVAPESSHARAALIAHELAHLARKDHWVSWLEVPAAALFWWNPLFWWIRGHIRHFAELSCDAWAVWAYPADRRVFAEALIDMQARTATAPVALQGLGATDSECKDFERRLDMIMKNRVTPGISRSVATVAVLAALLAAPGFSAGDGAKDAASASTPPAALERHVESARWMQKGEALFAAKDHAKALEVFREVVAAAPDNGKAHARIGYLLVGSGQLELAMASFQRQYELGYERSTALYNMACAKALCGRSDEALEYVAAAVRHGFANTDLMATDADLASIRDQAAFGEQVRLVTSARELRDELARLEKEGDRGTFLKAHAKLAKILSADGALQSEHGHLALAARDFDGAAWAFGRQAEVGFNVPTALYNRACARSLAGDTVSALADLRAAAEEGMHYAGIRADHDLDNVRQTADYAALEARIATVDEEGEKMKGLVKSGDLAAALPALKKVAKDESRSAKERSWALQTIGRSFLADQRFEDAYGLFEHAAALGMNVDECAFHMAEALAGQKKSEQALAHVGFALDLGYADPDALESFLEANELASAEKVQALVKSAAKHKAASSWGPGKDEKAWAKGKEDKAWAKADAKKVAPE